MIDLKRLFSEMTKNGYFYFSGLTNPNGEFDITFSTLHDGKGDYVEITMDSNQKYEIDIDTFQVEHMEDDLSEEKINELLDDYVFLKR